MQDSVDRVNSGGGFELDSITSRADIEERIRRFEAMGKEVRNFLTFYETLPEQVKEMAQQEVFTERDIETMIPNLVKGLRIQQHRDYRRQTILFCESAAGYLKFLHEHWGQWQYKSEDEGVLFGEGVPDRLVERHDELAHTLGDVSEYLLDLEDAWINNRQPTSSRFQSSPPPAAAEEGKQASSPLRSHFVPPHVPDNPALEEALTGALFIYEVIANQTPYSWDQIVVARHLIIDRDMLTSAGVSGVFKVRNVSDGKSESIFREIIYQSTGDMRFEERLIEGKKYVVTPLYEGLFTPLVGGVIDLPPYTMDLQMSHRSTITAEDVSPSTVTVGLRSAPAKLNVRPLPEKGRPDKYSGAVGNFTMSAKLARAKGRAEDAPLTLTVELRGEGQLHSVRVPELPAGTGLTLSTETTSTLEHEKQGERFVSVRTFTYPLRPMGNLPPAMTISVPAFDPRKKEYYFVSSTVQVPRN